MDDLTTRARVRDAAIAVFARDGLAASLRTIADEAGVSAGLLIHHFGSKEGLRAACDTHVLELTRSRNAAAVADRAQRPPAIGEQLAELGEAGPSLMYLLHSVRQGGELARTFIERLVADTVESMALGVATGVIRPSVDEAARARYLVSVSLGAMLVDLVMHPPPDPGDSSAIVAAHAERTMLPAAEYATHGILTDRATLDAVIDHRRSIP